MNDKLIKVQDKMYKEAQIIILKSEENKKLFKGQLWTHNNGGITKLHLWTSETTDVSTHELLGYCIPQHLHIVTSEKIKQGDWYIFKGVIYQAKHDNENNKEYIKIIASTDSSLINIEQEGYSKIKNKIINLPRPSYDFLKKYCELNGEIKDVLVEYEEVCTFCGNTQCRCRNCGRTHSLKIAPDDTISIIKKQNNFKELYMKALKKLDVLSDEQLDNFVNFQSKHEEKKYTEQEVRTLMFRSYNLCSVDEIPRSTFEMDKWIDKQLK